MDARWGAVELGGVFARAGLPCFLLDDAGALAYANPALHRLFGIADGDRDAWRSLAAGPLRAPASRADRAPQRVGRPAETPRGRQWLELLFVPLPLEDGMPLGVWGCVRTGAAPADLPTAPDAAALERFERHADELRNAFGFADVPARSAAMRTALARTRLAADARCSAAFVGPPGAGKLTLAKLAAAHAPRPRGRLVVHDGEAPVADALLLPPGKGTLVIRRLSLVPAALQAEVARRLGEANAGWRLLATERLPWERGVADGWLHPDLHAVCAPLVVAVPPLAERLEDFADLTTALLARGEPKRAWLLEPAALAALQRLPWPGNVRELAGALAEMAGRAAGAKLGAGDIPRRLAPAPAEAPLPALDATLEHAERDLLRSAAARFRGNKSKAATALGISRARFLRRWEQLGLGSADAAE